MLAGNEPRIALVANHVKHLNRGYENVWSENYSKSLKENFRFTYSCMPEVRIKRVTFSFHLGVNVSHVCVVWLIFISTAIPISWTLELTIWVKHFWRDCFTGDVALPPVHRRKRHDWAISLLGMLTGSLRARSLEGIYRMDCAGTFVLCN